MRARWCGHGHSGLQLPAAVAISQGSGVTAIMHQRLCTISRGSTRLCSIYRGQRLQLSKAEHKGAHETAGEQR